MTSPAEAAALALSLSLLSWGAASPQAASPTQPSPVISIFAGGNYGPGGWMLDIDSKWRMKTKMIGESDSRARTRQLTSEEREGLLKALASLPKEKSHYYFGKTIVTDASVQFYLAVGVGKEQSRYTVMDPLYEDRDRPELQPILAAMRSLRGLFKSTVAHVPPVVEPRPN